MELRDLEYFLAAIDSGSVSDGARRLGRSQQALSKSLARLEHSLGAQLIERTPKGVLPTELGKSLAVRARAMLAEAAKFHREVDVAVGRGSGHFAIGVSPIGAAGIAAPAIRRLRELFPRLRVTVEAGLETHFTKALAAGEIDLAITTGFEPADRHIMARPIGEEPWLVAGRDGHQLLADAGSLADLAGAEWLYGEVARPLQSVIDQSFTASGIDPPVPAVTTTSLVFAASFLAQSNLLAVLPRSIVARAAGLRGVDLAQGAWRSPIVALRRRRAVSSVVETRMMELLDAEAQAQATTTSSDE